MLAQRREDVQIITGNGFINKLYYSLRRQICEGEHLN